MSTEKKEKMNVGNAKAFQYKGKMGLNYQLDITKLGEYLKGEAKELIKTWKDKDGKEHKSINISLFPSDDQYVTEYKTHSASISTFIPDKNYKSQPQPIKVSEQVSEDEMPF